MSNLYNKRKIVAYIHRDLLFNFSLIRCKIRIQDNTQLFTDYKNYLIKKRNANHRN